MTVEETAATATCPVCRLAGGFHEEAEHAGPLPSHLQHLVRSPELERPKSAGRPSDEEIAVLRALKGRA